MFYSKYSTCTKEVRWANWWQHLKNKGVFLSFFHKNTGLRSLFNIKRCICFIQICWRNISMFVMNAINSSTHQTHLRLTFYYFMINVPLNTDFNFERLFFSNQSATNSRDFLLGSLLYVVRRHCVNWEVISSWRASQEKQEVIFDLPRPPTPGTKPFQTIPHPRARRAGLVPGVARGGDGNR